METKKLTCYDLMVGDYVMAKKEPIRIATPFGNETVLHQLTLYGYTSDGAKAGPFLETELTPIPLTSEILEKNGFIKYLWDIYRLPKTDFSIEHTGGLFILRISNERLCEIKSVSHLQHLLRDFGIEGDCAMSEYRIHPVFGKLTDPEEIAIFDRQQAEEDMEKAYLEDQQKAEYEAEMQAYEEAYQQAEYEYYWMLFMQENEMITD